MAETTLKAETRSEFGSSASKRIRRSGRVPAIVYGGSADSISLTLDPKQIFKVLRSEAGRNTILNLDIEGGSSDSVILKDWQVDPVKETMLHADFQRIAMDQVLQVTVPIAIRGEAIGVKEEDGLLEVVTREIEVECLPADIPERIECDVSELGMHQGIRVRDLPALENVKILADEDRVIVHVVAVAEEVEEVAPVEGEEAEVVAEGTEGEPEVVAKGKKEEEKGE